MLKEIEVRFATKTYEYINAKFDDIPTEEEYKKAKLFAETHRTYTLPKPVEPTDNLPDDILPLVDKTIEVIKGNGNLFMEARNK